MGIFDFFKRKELEEIKKLTLETKKLKEEVSNLNAQNKELNNQNKELNNQNQELNNQNLQLKRLEVYEHIDNAYAEAEKITGKAHDNANEILKNAKISHTNLLSEIAELENVKNGIIDNANSQAKEILKNLRLKIEKLKNKADTELKTYLSASKKIISEAEEKAKEIIGEAYQMNKDVDALTKTIEALKNKKHGYSDVYIIPTYTLLDDLAIDYGFTQAGKDLAQVRVKINSYIQNQQAGTCDYVEPNRKETAINFVVDAFNGKVTSVLSNIKHDNYGILKQKIIDSYHLVNDLGKAFRNAKITPEYLKLRLEELKYAIVIMEFKRQEQEEQRRIREEIREEERARKEYEKALKDLEKEQLIIKRTLEKAQKDFEKASENQKQKYEDILLDLKRKLKEAEDKSQRALSMAQQTKSGHIYIISNIGSFGDNIYKIGMTRRLEPLDRVKELGDASVPFPFDIHAMIYTDNAPKLEKDLHKHFIENQVNKINFRKEFFNVSLTEIKSKLEDLNIETKWTMTAEATEYRESLAITQEKDPKIKEYWKNSQKKMIDVTEYANDEIE